MRALAQDLPKDMAAVSMNPGIIDTDMMWISLEEVSSGYESGRASGAVLVENWVIPSCAVVDQSLQPA